MYGTSLILSEFVKERVQKATGARQRSEAKKLIIETNFFCPMVRTISMFSIV
jgi:hypothetical protein